MIFVISSVFLAETWHYTSMKSFEEKAQDAILNPQNMGEMDDADNVGTVGSADCGDMMRMWVKFKEKDGKKVIDKASFQAFGCQTALAVASMATEMLKGKSIEEAKNLGVNELSGDLGDIPPMKIHCGEMVQDALREALSGDAPTEKADSPQGESNTLLSDMNSGGKKVKIVFDK